MGVIYFFLENGGYSRRKSVLCHICIGSYPPPLPQSCNIKAEMLQVLFYDKTTNFFLNLSVHAQVFQKLIQRMPAMTGNFEHSILNVRKSQFRREFGIVSSYIISLVT